MKAKNQPIVTSESDARDKLVVYVYEYLIHSGAQRAAEEFLQNIHWEKEIQINQHESPGFLVNWWCVFWDLYCAAPDKKNLPEPSSEARAFHDYNMRQTVMSPSCTQSSPPQPCPPFMNSPGGGHMMATRYGHPPPMQHQMRGAPAPAMGMVGPPPRMQPMGNVGAPHPHHMPMHPHHSPMMGSPRYTPHSGHMTPGSSSSTPMGPEPGPSPGLTQRMTPNHIGSPHPQNGMARGGPPPPGSQQAGWQSNFSVANSPADQQSFIQVPTSQPQPPPQHSGANGPPGPNSGSGDFGSIMMNDGGGNGMMELKPGSSNGEEYVMPGYAQQDHHGHGEAAPEILKLKESLEGTDSDQTFNLDYQDPQSKWT